MLPETSSSIANEQQQTVSDSSSLETKVEMCTQSMQNLKPQSKIDLQPTNASVSIVEDSSKAEIPFPAKAQHSSSRKLRRSATTMSSSPKDSKDTMQANSNEDTKSTPENQNEVLKEPTPIIEVKKPPSYEATWGKSSEHVGGINEVETSTNKLDSTCNNGFDAEKQKKSSRDTSNTRIKSSIPRLMKSKPPEKSRMLLGNEKEKKTVGSPSRIPKTCPSPRPVQSSALNNLSKRSTPNRSRASNISSGMLSPASGATSHRSKSPVSSSPVSCQSVAKNDDTEIRNMLDKMYTTLNKLKDEETYEDNAAGCSQGKKQGDKNVDYLLPAKDGAGETISRTDSLEYSEKEPLLKECLINSTADLLERIAKRTDLFHYLSELNNQNQTNLRDLHDIIKHSLKSKGPSDRVDPNQVEMQFYKVEQAQIELIQRLSKAIRQLYDDRERLQEDINKLNLKYQAIPELEDKIALLQAENTGLLEKVKRISQNLEDEKVVSQKRKITTQTVNQLKAKLQKAESKLLQMEKKANDLSTWGKKLEASVKQKESIVEQGSKKMKVIESTLQELEDENNKLKRELEDIRTNENERFGNLVKNSQELKDAKVELMQAQEKLNEEAARREKVSTKLQDTSAKLKSMEEKCKNLTSLVDSAKAEVKAKHTESTEKESKLTEEISQLTTELQARKVMLKVAENEVGFIKSKLEKLETHSKQEQEKDRSTNEVEEQLKMDLLLRDEQITQLQEQIKVLVEKKFNREPHSKSKNRLTKSAEKSQNTFSERVQLTAQVVDLERTIDALAKDNLQLNQILNQKNLELDQRDRILKMQTDVLKIRDELIWLLKSKESKHEEDIQRLNDIIQERENAISKEWNRALEDNYQANALKKWQKMGESPNDVDPSYGSNEESMYLSGTMYELYSSLEKKQMELEMMQQRVQQLESLQDAYNQQRTRKEARINQLEMALSDRCLDSHGYAPILAQ